MYTIIGCMGRIRIYISCACLYTYVPMIRIMHAFIHFITTRDNETDRVAVLLFEIAFCIFDYEFV